MLRSRPSTIWVTSVLGFSLLACSEAPGPLPSGDTGITRQPGPDVGAARDAGLPDAENTDAEVPDAPAPDAAQVRRLKEVGLFGDSPVENRVNDPSFDLYAAGWFGVTVDTNSPSFVPLVWHAYARTPTGQPVIELKKGRGNLDIAAMGNGRGLDRPLVASVFLGRRAGTLEGAEASILGTGLDGNEVAYALVADASPSETLDGITWQRYFGRIDPPTIGWVQFFVANRSSEPLFITGPALLEAPRRRMLDSSTARPRQRTRAEDQGAQKWAERMRDQLRPPSRRLPRPGVKP